MIYTDECYVELAQVLTNICIQWTCIRH